MLCLQKHNAKPDLPLMASLPQSRLQAFTLPFYNTGVDYFGLLLVKEEGFTEVARQLFGNFWPFEQLLSNLWFRAFFRHLFSIRESISFLSDKNLFFMHFLSNKTNKYPC